MHSNNRTSQYLSSAESSTYFDAKMCHGVSEILTDAVRLTFQKSHENNT